MPELPDVEVFRRTLSRSGLHRKVTGVRVHEPMLLRGVSASSLSKSLTNRSFETTRRRGKYLLARTDSDRWLVLHFGMTGELRRQAIDEPALDHAVLSLDLSDGHRLVVRDERKLGEISLVDDPDDLVERHELGPDALSLDREAFEERLAEHGGMLKGFLMDQSTVAGLGNIYVDEILFHARQHPQTETQSLDAKARSGLYRAMRHVLRRAIEGRATREAFPRTWLIHRRANGSTCPRCGGRIDRLSVGGRSTYLCPSCQPRQSR